jgi:uncharacterized surface protein with fasciclin (FAS1) repeats
MDFMTLREMMTAALLFITAAALFIDFFFIISVDEEYTLFVPTNAAIQAWHPIDWGFYPFVVPEFTRETLKNHFVHKKWTVSSLKEQETLQTIGGKTLQVRIDNDSK